MKTRFTWERSGGSQEKEMANIRTLSRRSLNSMIQQKVHPREVSGGRKRKGSQKQEKLGGEAIVFQIFYDLPTSTSLKQLEVISSAWILQEAGTRYRRANSLLGVIPMDDREESERDQSGKTSHLDAAQLSLSVIPLRFIQFVAHIKNLFLYISQQHPWYISATV